MSTDSTERILAQFQEEIRRGRLVALATVLSEPGRGKKVLLYRTGEHTGMLENDTLHQQVLARMAAAMESQQPERLSVSAAEQEWDVFIDVQAPPPRLIVVGAVHIAIHLVAIARQLGFHTVVVDARSAFATAERFGHADQLITQWPADALVELEIDESTSIAVLTHDEKLDNPSLLVAINSPAQYIGALGARKTHAKRVAALQAEGATEAQLERIHAPIGLNLGGRKPEEIALAIMAEIVAVRNGSGFD